MFKIYKTNKSDIDRVSEFIERLNSDFKNNIGYCAKDKNEIEKALNEDFYDEEAEGIVLAATIDEKIVGVIGCDCDIEDGSGEVWGPFIDEDDYETWMKIAFMLWDNLEEACAEIKEYSMFINSENEKVISFAKEKQAEFKERHEILVLNKENFKTNNCDEIKELTKEFYDDMAKLHDKSFNNPYLSGQEIISRIKPCKKVFIYEKEGKVLGYVYIEVEEEFGEGSIEFLAVDEDSRKNGLGYKLLNRGIQHIFSYENVYHINLCAKSSNLPAVNLYKRNGFITESYLEYFKLQR